MIGITVTIIEHPAGFLIRIEHDGGSIVLDRVEALDLHQQLEAIIRKQIVAKGDA